jgi:hypothetical protein
LSEKHSQQFDEVLPPRGGSLPFAPIAGKSAANLGVCPEMVQFGTSLAI